MPSLAFQTPWLLAFKEELAKGSKDFFRSNEDLATILQA